MLGTLTYAGLGVITALLAMQASRHVITHIGGIASCSESVLRGGDHLDSDKMLTCVVIASLVCFSLVSHANNGLAIRGILLVVLAGWLLALSLVDARTKLLPDAMTLPLLWLGLAGNIFDLYTPLESAVIGAMAGYASLWLLYWGYRFVCQREGLGYGDMKLSAAVGAWLGWEVLPAFFVTASLIGLAYVTIRRFKKSKSDIDPAIPFGPCLAVAGVVLSLMTPSFLWADSLLR